MVPNELNNMRGLYPCHLNYIHGCYIQSSCLEMAIWASLSGRAKGILGSDQAGPDLNRASILLAQPSPISGHRASLGECEKKKLNYFHFLENNQASRMIKQCIYSIFTSSIELEGKITCIVNESEMMLQLY